MDIKFVNDNYQFIYRVSSIIFNKDMSKVLLFSVEGRNFYLLPGGKVNQKEKSIEALKREIKEELGFENIEFSFLGLSEEFVESNGFYNQQINVIYKGILYDEIKNSKFKGLEGEWCNFEWVDVNEIKNYNIFPNFIKNVIKENKSNFHIIEDLT